MLCAHSTAHYQQRVRMEIPEASEGVKYIFCRIPSVVIAPTAVVYGVTRHTKTNILGNTRRATADPRT